MGGKPRFVSFLVMNLSSVVEGGHALLKRGRTGSRIELQVGHGVLR
jgi:hypothetical protein